MVLNLGSLDVSSSSECNVLLIQGTVSWAMAGRNAEKLEGVRAKIAAIDDKCKVRKYLW